jgi:choline dehydrogenase-like flavoprotein
MSVYNLNKKYDFIIVGGGPAGCVLARRLVDTGKVSVLLLEAGPNDNHPLIRMPAGFTKLTGASHSWGYETVPQRGLKGTTIWYPQGRVLGGGSSINAQVYTRGNKWDYDNWADHGCKGWSYEEILPYFRKSEDNNRIVDDYHGQGGPLKVSDALPHKLTTAFLRAAQQAGLPFNPDFNGAEQTGSGFYQVNNRDGVRCSASSGYLDPIRDDANLSLRTSAHVTRIEFKHGHAVAVHVRLGSAERRIEARKEILLTAGAIGSPRMLLHSGVGPAGDLRQIGIDSVIDIPGVGQNLQDHMDIFCVSECSGDYSFDKFKPWYMAAWAGAQYLLYGTGVVASNICDGGGFWYADENATTPDVQFHFLPGSGLEHGLKQIKNGVTLNSAFLRPRSRGSVKLKSSDPLEKPLIDPNYWDDSYDVECSVKAFKRTRQIMQQDAFKPFIKSESMPGTDCRSDDDIKQYACKHSKTDYHPVGTCKMGAENDPTSVVTPDLRLKGAEGIRVCDSSIMPFLNSSNTNAPTVMIAEKAADMIMADHHLHR